jgi:hypothetical protein
MKNDAVKKESYEISVPKIYVGNLIMGDRYIEPQGKTVIENKWTGDKCTCDYKIRGGLLYTNSDNIHAIEGIITDQNGEQRYKLVGKYTDKIEAINLKTKERWTVFEAPELPPQSSEMHNMNYFALQLNLLSDNLRSKLPPTDSRLREDVRAWEFGELEASQNEKTRLEQN